MKNFEDINLDLIFDKIDIFLKEKRYGYRNLVNIFFDYSIFKKNCNFIISLILELIEGNKNRITPFSCTQILTSCYRLKNHSKLAYILIDKITNALPNFYEAFTLEQKLKLFKTLFDLELPLNIPNYKNPKFLQTLAEDFENNFDQLNIQQLQSLHLILINDFQFIELKKKINDYVLILIKNRKQTKSYNLINFWANNGLNKFPDKDLYEIGLIEIGNRIKDDIILKYPTHIKMISKNLIPEFSIPNTFINEIYETLKCLNFDNFLKFYLLFDVLIVNKPVEFYHLIENVILFYFYFNFSFNIN